MTSPSEGGFRPAIIVFTISAAAVFSASCSQSEDVKATIDSLLLDSNVARVAAAAESAALLDEWNKAEVVKRLSEAGLVVSDRGEVIRQPFLSVPGELLQVSESHLQLFIYPTVEAREADSRKLEPTLAAPSNVAVSWLQPPHLIVSGKLLAIHLTHNEHLAERVSDVLTARHAGVAP